MAISNTLGLNLTFWLIFSQRVGDEANVIFVFNQLRNGTTGGP